MPTPLKLSLPILPDGHLYQLIHQAEIRRSPLASTLQYQILLYFIEKSPKESFRKSHGAAIPHWIEIGDSYDCVRGSLWTDRGKPVSDGRKYRDEVTKEKFTLLNSICTFQIGAEPLVAVKLGDLFPEEIVKLNSFLDTVPDTRVLVKKIAGKTIIIPCFEILRVFYYQAGDALTNHFFSNEPLFAICHAVVAPSQDNNFTAHIELYDNRFSERQSAVLGEMSLNPAYRRAVEAAHSRLSELINSAPGNDETYPHIDFHVGRDFEVKANGFGFEVDSVPYFFVCRLWPIQSPFCFEALVVDLTDDPRLGPVSDEHFTESTDGVSGGVRFRADMSNEPPLDSGPPGSSRYQGASIDAGERSGAVWPGVSLRRKKTATPHQPTSQTYVTQTPESLSQTGGGSDEKIAKTSKSKPTKEREITCTEYFREIIAQFQGEEKFEVKLLTVNNDDAEHGQNLSILAEENTQCIHIASIKCPEGYFYFFQLLRRGRAVFVHKMNPTMMTDEEVKDLLKLFIAENLNWSLAKKKHNEQAKEQPTLQNDQDRLILYPRNYSNGTLACAELCKDVINNMIRTPNTSTSK